MNTRSLSLAAAVCLACLAAPASANLLTNPGFELGTLVNDGNATMTLNAGSTTITGWTVTGDQLSWIQAGNPFGLTAQDGSRFLDLTAYVTGAPFGGVTQSIATAAGLQYLLTFYIGSYTQRWGGPPVSIQASAAGTTQNFSVTTASTASTWTPFSMTFIATGTTTSVTLTGSAGVEYIGLDNVSVDQVGGAAVPEPATYGLFALGLATLALYRKRRHA
jgi:hypothetical protein